MRSSISNAHRYEEEKRRTERLALIARTGQRIAARLTRDELIDTLVNELHDQLGYEHAALFLLDSDDPSHLVQRACATLWPRSVAIGYRLPLNQGVVGAAGRLRTVQQVNDVLQSPIYISMSGVRGEDEPLAEIAAEKTTETIESPAAGKITEILVTEGSTVPVRTPVAIIEKA